MEIDLNFNEIYELDEIVSIPKEYITLSKVKKLDHIKVVGKIYYNIENEVWIKANISGIMILEDDISLDQVEYPFSIEYDDRVEENLINSEFRLDLFEFLWENIVLEVPLKFTKVTNLSEFHGDGWKLMSEDDLSLENNPFHDLLKDFDKKE